jgi:pSer/pThr/pTyr-binding forkhead associated (FHA) protein
MEKLVVLSDEGSPQEFPLVEKRLVIGRDEACDICLSDRSVSRHHATLLRVFHGFSIEDERSTNGTRVNGIVVTKRFLKHGDLIEIGKYNLRYISQVPHHEMEDPDRTVVLKPVRQSGAGSQPADQHADQTLSGIPLKDSAKTPSPSADISTQKPELTPPVAGQAKVRFLEGEQKGDERIIDRSFFSVGNPGGDLVLINQRHNGYYLLKVGGKNVPMINGKPVKAGGVALQNGDHITLGELSLEFID